MDAGKEKGEELGSLGRGYTYIYRSAYWGMALDVETQGSGNFQILQKAKLLWRHHESKSQRQSFWYQQALDYFLCRAPSQTKEVLH